MCCFTLPSPSRSGLSGGDGMKRAWSLFPPTDGPCGASSLSSGPLCWHLACHRVSLSWWEHSLQPDLGQRQDVKGSRWLERRLAHSDTGSFNTASLDWVWHSRADWSYLLFDRRRCNLHLGKCILSWDFAPSRREVDLIRRLLGQISLLCNRVAEMCVNS